MNQIIELLSNLIFYLIGAMILYISYKYIKKMIKEKKCVSCPAKNYCNKSCKS